MAEPIGLIIGGAGVLVSGIAYAIKATWAIAHRNGSGKDKKMCGEHETKIGIHEEAIGNLKDWLGRFDEKNSKEHAQIIDSINNHG